MEKIITSREQLKDAVIDVLHEAITSVQIDYFLKPPTEPGTTFTGYEELTDNEKRLFNALKAIKHESLWKPAIDQVINTGTVTTFLRLIISLKSQARDNPQSMKIILERAYELLIRI